MIANKCRFCGIELKQTFVNLGMSPLSNSYITSDNLESKELFFPLHAYLCTNCFLVQLPLFEKPENIFSEYSYLSSYSSSWLDHAKEYVEMMMNNGRVNSDSFVIEIASNDGYLLQYFLKKGIKVLGIEPAKNIANIANDKGIDTISEFFCAKFADKLHSENRQADLIIANNVLAHVPDINSFVRGIQLALKPDGIVTIEFPSLLNLIQYNQFDTIYHEHFSYLSFGVVNKILQAHGLKIYAVDSLETHGGSLRVYACKAENEKVTVSKKVNKMLQEEDRFGLNNIDVYNTFSESVKLTKREILTLLISIKEKGKTIVGYGAPAKGNTLLNYCGIRDDFLDYTVDLSPQKRDNFLPGTHLPILSVDTIKQTKPDYIFILPWNLKSEIMNQLGFVKQWGGKFIIPIPKVEVIEL